MYKNNKYLLVLLILGLFLPQTIVQAQTEEEAIQTIRKDYSLWSSKLETYQIIGFVAVFDTGGEGLVLLKNDFLDYDLSNCFTHNTERDITFYFEGEQLRLIIDSEYDPVESAYSQTREYYIKDKQLFFYYEVTTTINWWVEVDDGAYPITRTEVRKYYNDSKLVRHTTKVMEATINDIIDELSARTPPVEQALKKSENQAQMEKLLKLVYPAWMLPDE